MRRLETAIEWIIFNSRWTLAPIYLGLAAALLLLVFHFLKEFIEFALHIAGASSSAVTLAVLGLIDLAFLANLVLIVILSGFENFVSRIEAHDRDRPDWMTKVDFGGLNQKLMVSIVAISAIEVLKSFMNIDKIDDRRLGWTVGIHLLFLFSMLIVALSDRFGVAKSKNEQRVEAGDRGKY
ncbi:MAG: TIGR00645 family protein [Rhodoplanes sp.]